MAVLLDTRSSLEKCSRKALAVLRAASRVLPKLS